MNKLRAPNSQMTEGIYLLLQNNFVTRADAFRLAGILNYPAIIEILRNKHLIPIATDMIEVENKFGRGVSYGRYKCLHRDKLLLLYNALLDGKKVVSELKKLEPLSRNFQKDLFNG